jgi:flagellar biosynthetic protein FliQ
MPKCRGGVSGFAAQRQHSGRFFVNAGRQDQAMSAFAILLREALIVTAVLVLPILALATVVGAGVAIVQAATQVQEQTLTLLPKVLVVGAALALFGAFGMNLCAQLFNDVLARIPALVHGA